MHPPSHPIHLKSTATRLSHPHRHCTHTRTDKGKKEAAARVRAKGKPAGVTPLRPITVAACPAIPAAAATVALRGLQRAMYHSGRHSHRLSLLRVQRAWSDGLAGSGGRGRLGGGRLLLQQQPPPPRLPAPPSLGRRGLSTARPGAAAGAAGAAPVKPGGCGRRSFTLVLRRGSGLVGLCSLLVATLDGNPFLGAASSSPSCAPGPGQQGPTGRGSRPYGGNDGGDDADSIVRAWLHNALGPVGGEATFGCIVGFSSGYALKKVGKAAAFFIGVGFLAAQMLHWVGYIDVNWAKLERHLISLLDRDGDSRLTERDLQYYWAKAKECLTYQLPSTGGFVTGFAVGFYKG